MICGAISQYDDMDNVVGPSMYLRLAERQSRMEGFAYFHFPDSIPIAMGELAGWVADGSLVVPETVLDAGRLRVLPHRHGADGSFAARLRRGMA